MIPLYALSQVQSGIPAFKYMNPALPVDQRVDDLIGRMTLEEKVSQLAITPMPCPSWGSQIRVVE
jgi:beta-glucosidase